MLFSQCGLTSLPFYSTGFLVDNLYLGVFNRVKHDDAIVFPGFHLKTVVSSLITRNPKKGPLHCSKNFVESFHIILVKFTYP